LEQGFGFHFIRGCYEALNGWRKGGLRTKIEKIQQIVIGKKVS
jgi:hypothetical protein